LRGKKKKRGERGKRDDTNILCAGPKSIILTFTSIILSCNRIRREFSKRREGRERGKKKGGGGPIPGRGGLLRRFAAEKLFRTTFFRWPAETSFSKGGGGRSLFTPSTTYYARVVFLKRKEEGREERGKKKESARLARLGPIWRWQT